VLSIRLRSSTTNRAGPAPCSLRLPGRPVVVLLIPVIPNRWLIRANRLIALDHQSHLRADATSRFIPPGLTNRAHPVAAVPCTHPGLED